MGYSGFDYSSFNEIYTEHARLTAGTNLDIDGLNYEILKEKRSVQWPLKDGERLFKDHQFYTPSQKAMIHAVSHENRSEQLSREFPFVLTTGRIRDQWHTMSRSGKVSKLKRHIGQAFLEVHPVDARKLDIQEGDNVVVRSARGEVRVPAKVSATIKPGVVFLPMHWGKIAGNDLNRTNNITSDFVDPVSKEPDFKYCAVSVQKYRKPKQRIVVIGAGAGAFGFVRSYREINKEDEIIIFSKENFPFYNRVLLPDYISGVQDWEELVKMKDEEEARFNIRLHRGLSIESIDRKEKYVVDSRGNRTGYDILIMATGSRAAIPPNVPRLKGIFTMRSRTDADQFIDHVPKNGHVVIVGGGLLGLELAASLREVGVRITIIQRISRFLDRQLDVLGSQLLQEEMAEQGCEMYFNDEVQQYFGQEQLSAIKLKSGVYLECDALVIAIGTIPNAELARTSGIDCQRGVIVNERLQTSDPDIYAIGEIAEFKGFLFGITAAAEQQADVVAKYINGDISSCYEGSLLMNIIKIHGFDLCSMGIPECPDDKDYEEITFIDRSKRYYKKCIIYKDRLVGAILIGDKSEFQEFRELISNKTELSEKRLQLLRNGSKADPVLGKLVCSCNNVGSINLENKVREGCSDMKRLCAATGAATGCGSCRPEVQRILTQILQMPVLENEIKKIG
jgi:ferredoxin-nitrate reductase